jgi:hypothetical protein
MSTRAAAGEEPMRIPAENALWPSDFTGWRRETRCEGRRHTWRVVAPDKWATNWTTLEEADRRAIAEMRRRLGMS